MRFQFFADQIAKQILFIVCGQNHRAAQTAIVDMVNPFAQAPAQYSAHNTFFLLYIIFSVGVKRRNVFPVGGGIPDIAFDGMRRFILFGIFNFLFYYFQLHFIDGELQGLS